MCEILAIIGILVVIGGLQVGNRDWVELGLIIFSFAFFWDIMNVLFSKVRKDNNKEED